MSEQNNRISEQETTILAMQAEINDLKTKLNKHIDCNEELQKFKDGINISSDGLWVWSIKTDKHYYSDNTKLMLGYDLTESSAESMNEWGNRIHAEDLEHTLEKLNDHLEGKSDKYVSEYRMRTNQGAYFWVLDEGAITERDEKGQPTKITGVFKSIEVRKKAEALLAINQEKYKALFDQSSEAFFILDNMKIMECNQACTILFDLPEAEIVNRSILDFLPPYQADGQSSEEKACKLVEKTFSSGQQRLEWLYRGENETIRTADVHLSALLYNHQKQLHISFRDITKEKEIDTKLRTLERAVEQSPVSIVITNIDGDIEYVNPKAIDATGYSKEELINRNPRILQSGKTEIEKYKEVWQTIKNGKTWKGLFYNKKKNGELYWESSTIAPVTNSKGDITHFVAIKEDVTKKKESEEELIKFKTISERAIYGTCTVDLEGNLLYLNKAFADMHGYKQEELLGKSLSMLNKNQDLEAVYETNEGDTEKELSKTLEVWHLKSDGTEFPTLTSITVVEDEEGKPAFYAATIVDISEQKKAEEYTHSQNEKLNAIIDAIPDLVFVISKDGIYEDFYASGTVKKKHLKQEHIIGKHLLDVFEPKEVDKHLSKIKVCLETEEIITYEYNLNIRGNEMYYETRLVPISHDKVLGFVRDLTSSKQKAETINQLSLAVNQSPVSVMITDLEGTVTFTNPAFTEMSGYSSEEILGQNASILSSGKNDPELYVGMWETISAGKVWKNEWINKKKGGDFYWEEVSISPVIDDQGKIISYLAIIEDITQRKNDLEQIMDLNSNLEKKVSERTFEIEQANRNLQLEIEEKDKAEKALREKKNELEMFFDVSLDLLCIGDLEGNILKVNKAWSTTMGYSKEVLESSKFYDYIHPDDLEKTFGAVERFENQEPIQHFENRWRASDGIYRHIEWKGMPVGNKTYNAARDVTDRKQKEKFELELLDLSARITTTPHSEIDSALNLSLNRIGQFLNADRAYIFEIDLENDSMANTYEWCKDGVEPQIDILVNLACDTFPALLNKLRNNENVIIRSVQDLSDAWKAEKDILEPQNVQSLVILPLISEGSLIGYVGLDSVAQKRDYSETEVKTLSIWGSIFNSLLSNRNSEKKLAISQQNFETFFNTVDDLLMVLDEKGNTIHVNNTVTERLGYHYDELINKSALILHPAEFRDEAAKIMRDIFSNKAEFCPVPVAHKSGEIIPVETRVRLGKWNGKPAIFSVSKDISKIYLSEQKFSKAFESGAAMMAISDTSDGKYLDVNNKFVETHGYEKNEIIGQTEFDLKLIMDNEQRMQMINSLKSNIPVRDMEVLIRSKCGEIKTLLMSVDLIYLGETRCVLTVAIDISERKIMEEQLKLARTEAEQANLAKSEFLSRMSHELRTPMNSILGFTQLLEMSELDKIQSTAVKHILNSGKHLLELINEVLNISRIESGHLSLAIETIKIVPLINEMLDLIQPLALKMGVTLEYLDANTNNCFVKADRQSLKQILLNLLSNAIKYNNPDGYVKLTCEKSETDKYIRISVTDNGIGISEPNLAIVFEPFERFAGDEIEIEGTGLGLAVVKKLVLALDGKIGVSSKLGHGSTFWFELLACSSHEEEEVATDEAYRLSKNASVSATVLYIEDNEINCLLVEQTIETQRPKLKLVIEKHGIKALSLVTDIQPDLILLDMNLPDIHGAEVLKTLKSNPLTQKIPVVVISADSTTERVQQSLLDGADEYLTKPIDIKHFIDVLDSHIKKSRTLKY